MISLPPVPHSWYGKQSLNAKSMRFRLPTRGEGLALGPLGHMQELKTPNSVLEGPKFDPDSARRCDLKKWTQFFWTSVSLCIWQPTTYLLRGQRDFIYVKSMLYWKGLFGCKIWWLLLLSIPVAHIPLFRRGVHTLDKQTARCPFRTLLLKMCVWHFVSLEAACSEWRAGRGWPLVTRVSSGPELAYPIEPNGKPAGIQKPLTS